MGTGQPFGSYQNEIYLNGLGGIVPSYPMAFAELEDRASSALSPSVWSYVAGGAGDERTQRANTTAFDHWGLVPRMFVGAAERDLSVDLFGMKLPSPSSWHRSASSACAPRTATATWRPQGPPRAREFRWSPPR